MVYEGSSFLEMKPSKYSFYRKEGKNYIFLNPEGKKEIWKKIQFSKPGFVLKHSKMLFEFKKLYETEKGENENIF